MQAERRSSQRLPWVEMEAKVKVRRNLIAAEWVDVDIVDFNAEGLGLITPLTFSQDERLQLSLKLDTEVGELWVKRVTGRVRHQKDHPKGQQFGLEFEPNQGEEVTASLSRIEGILSRHQRLVQRYK